MYLNNRKEHDIVDVITLIVHTAMTTAGQGRNRLRASRRIRNDI